jgi:hypothetical protein
MKPTADSRLLGKSPLHEHNLNYARRSHFRELFMPNAISEQQLDTGPAPTLFSAAPKKPKIVKAIQRRQFLFSIREHVEAPVQCAKSYPFELSDS